MLLHFSRSIQTQTISWFPLKAFINKVCCLERPAIRQFWTLDWNLFSKNHITNLFSASTNIWSPPKHEFISYNTKGKIIHSIGVILSTHHFRRHISRCSWSIRAIIRPENFCNSHISDSAISVRFHHYVLRFDISMNYSLIMHVFKSKHHARNHELRFFLIESPSLSNMVSEITTRK